MIAEIERRLTAARANLASATTEYAQAECRGAIAELEGLLRDTQSPMTDTPTPALDLDAQEAARKAIFGENREGADFASGPWAIRPADLAKRMREFADAETVSLRTQLSVELEAVKADRERLDAESGRMYSLYAERQGHCKMLETNIATYRALIEKAVEALGEAGETLQWIGEARLGLSGPGDGKDRKADAEDIFGVYATLDRLAKLRADLTAAIGKGEGT